jgi:imidazolonepropionase-like amidohydrolase
MSSRRFALAATAFGLIAMLSAPTGAAQRGVSAAPTLLVVRDVTVIDGTGAAPRPHQSIVVRDGQIADIIAAGSEPAGGAIVDGAGRFAIPGLFDAHVHVTGGTRDEAVAELKRALDGGITSVWDLAGDARMAGELAREAFVGEIDSPTLYYVALMAGPAFFTDPRVLGASRGFAPGEAPWTQVITPTTDIARAVAVARGTGAASLKLYAALDGDTVRRIGDEARRQGMRIVAHATVFPAKPSDLVAAGVTMMAHAAYLVWEGSPPTADFTKRANGDFAGVPVDSPAIEHVLEGMRDRNIALNPTLWIFAEGLPKDDLRAQRIAWMYAVTKRAAALGVPIVAGTDHLIDAANDPLPLIHRELEQLATGAELTPMQALQAATRNAARALGVDAKVGTIEPGKAADILLLDANPLDDIKNTRKIRAVIKGGRAVPR